jgi:hypothetical protein
VVQTESTDAVHEGERLDANLRLTAAIPLASSDWKADQSHKQTNASLCRSLGPKYRDRSFGRHIVWNLARGGTCDRTAKNVVGPNPGQATTDTDIH